MLPRTRNLIQEVFLGHTEGGIICYQMHVELIAQGAAASSDKGQLIAERLDDFWMTNDNHILDNEKRIETFRHAGLSFRNPRLKGA